MADIRFEVVKQLGVLSVSAKGWTKEINVISWNDALPMYDIRSWSPDRTKMSKGITLNDFELARLVESVEQHGECSALLAALKGAGDVDE